MPNSPGDPLHLTEVSRAVFRRREEPAGEERRRPDTLQLWQERERRQQQQQQQSGGWGSPPQGQGRAGGPGAAGPRAEATPQACVLTVWPARAHACSASCSVLKRGIRAAGASSSSAQAASK